ncbi:MAG: leucine-rich repeat domain-containing protein, partial [Paludibacteraceae bacterium]|nr:leucine-rich repeat domain-containing protein [Paludibacteraceae bacterium]
KAISNDITNCVINENCESIACLAFDGCSNITNIIIPNSVSSIGEGAFRGCSGLVSIISNAITPPAYFDDNEFNAFDMVSDYNILLYVPAGSLDEYRTADGWKNFTNIYGIDDAGICGDNVIWTFEESTGKLTISGTGPMYDYVDENFGYLSSPSYYGCKIKEIIIEEGVTSIGNGAFDSCRELENISIPNTVESIGWYAFSGCEKLTSIEIPESVMNIEWFAFYGCSGLERIITSGGKYWEGENCLIMNEGWGDNRLVWGGKNCVIPDFVTAIDGWAFAGCTELTSINIPEGVSWIRISAFDGCSGLTSVTLPSSVSSMEDGVFAGCTGLTAVTVKAINPPVFDYYSSAFSNYDIPLYVPAESIEAYRTADVWANFTNILPIPIPTTGFNEATCEKNEVRKMLIDGTVYVEKDGVRYNLNAQKIR